MRLEQTPLGLAREAIDAAKSEIDDALAEWQEAWSASFPDPSGLVARYPCGDFEVELRPDSESLGFEAVFEFSEDPGPDAAVFTRKLAAVFEKHGIARVTVVGVHIDHADVEAFTCRCNPADRTGGGHDPDCPEFDPAADAEPTPW